MSQVFILVIKDQNQYFNRLIWMRPDGTYEIYDKRHLFRMADENQTYTAGNSRLLVMLKGWNICLLICYDLRFPVWSRNTNAAYDLLIYVANWPAKRQHAWNSLLVARAIENLTFTIGVNRIGIDGQAISYSGDSTVCSPTGEKIWHSQEETAQTLTLQKKELEEYRKIFPAYLDADTFTIH